jgi:hypothetical protein
VHGNNTRVVICHGCITPCDVATDNTIIYSDGPTESCSVCP